MPFLNWVYWFIVHFGYVYSHQSRKLAGGADPSPLIRELSLLTTQNIDNSLIFGGDLDRASDIMAAIVQHNGQTDSLDMTREDVEVTIIVVERRSYHKWSNWRPLLDKRLLYNARPPTSSVKFVQEPPVR